MQRKMYKKLKETAPTDLLEAVVHIQHADRPDEVERFLRLGFALARPNGWMHVAPAWLQDKGE